MPGYVVESMFTLEDKASKTLLALIGNLEKADKALQGIQKMLTQTGKSLITMGTAAKPAADIFGVMNKEWANTNKQLAGMATKMDGVANILSTTTRAGEGFTAVVSEMTGQVNKLAAAAMDAKGAIRGMGSGAGGMTGFSSPSRGRHSGSFKESGFGGGFASGLAMKVNPMLALPFVMGNPMAGAGVAAGMVTAGVAGGSIGAAVDYQHKLNLLRYTGGYSPEELTATENAAQAMAHTIPGTTVTGNLEDLREVYGIFSDPKVARQLAPYAIQTKMTLEGAAEHIPAFGEGRASQLVQTILKAAEKTGRATPEGVKDIADVMVRSFVASGGLVDPNKFNQVLTTMRSARIGLDTGAFPAIAYTMAEYGGRGGRSGATGAMFSNYARAFQMGVMTKPMAQGLQKLGLLPQKTDAGQPIDLKTSTIHTLIAAHLLKGADLMLKNPFRWTTDILVPALAKAMHLTHNQWEALTPEQKKAAALKYLPGMAGTAFDLQLGMLVNEQQIKRFEQTYGKVSPGAIQQLMTGDISFQTKIVAAEMTNLFRTIGSMPGVITALSDTLTTLSSILIQTDDTARGFSNILKKLFPQPAEHSPTPRQAEADARHRNTVAYRQIVAPIKENLRQLEMFLRHPGENTIKAISSMGKPTAPMSDKERRRLQQIQIARQRAVMYGQDMTPVEAAHWKAVQDYNPGPRFHGGADTGLQHHLARPFFTNEQQIIQSRTQPAMNFSMPPINITVNGTNLINIPALTKMMQDTIAKWLAMFMKGFAGSHAGQTPMTDVVSHG